MEELIFFAIIIFFSIIDSIARTRKKRQAERTGQTGRMPEEWDEPDELPTYDDVPSYDDPYEMAPYEARTPSGGSAPTSSEGMIPSDIWEEIAGLARGRLPEPEPEPLPVEIEPIPPRPVARHRVHRAHAEFGTDPSSRSPSKEGAIDPLRVTLSRDARAVRRQLRSHSRSALRQAVILQEVLGPPAATRPERFQD